ncbi:hypothetical protein D3C85_249990 [compost metagenome]
MPTPDPGVPGVARTPLPGERSFLIGSASGGSMLLAPARCPGWPPARWVIRNETSRQCPLRRYLRLAPGVPVPAAGPRAADRLDAQGGHRLGRSLRWGPVAARTPLTGERGFLIGSTSGGSVLLAPGR